MNANLALLEKSPLKDINNSRKINTLFSDKKYCKIIVT